MEVMTQPNRLKTLLFTVLSFAVALLVSFAAAEGIVRLKNASMKDYNTEMWRYARELKFPSPDPRLGHEHVANSHAVLQSVDIRTNAWGLRGGPASETPAPGTRRILILGSSVALGWGVDEDKVVSSLLQKKFAAARQPVEVLNGGIGNYNAERYIERFFSRLAPLRPTDLLILAFVRDGEELTQGGGNFLLRNSQLAVTAWTAINRVLTKTGEANLVDHYRQIYAPGSPALTLMQAEFAKLAAYAREHDIRVTMAMVPDIHSLTNYPLGFVHAVFAQAAHDNGFAYIDLLPAFQGLTPEEIYAMPGDPHPNARGHALMAEAIYGVLAQARETEGTR
jgi:lysophospholipase L1-like esterase